MGLGGVARASGDNYIHKGGAAQQSLGRSGGRGVRPGRIAARAAAANFPRYKPPREQCPATAAAAEPNFPHDFRKLVAAAATAATAAAAADGQKCVFNSCCDKVWLVFPRGRGDGGGGALDYRWRINLAPTSEDERCPARDSPD